MAQRVPRALMRGMHGFLLGAYVLLLVYPPRTQGLEHPALATKPGDAASHLVPLSLVPPAAREVATRKVARKGPEKGTHRGSRKGPEKAGPEAGSQGRRPQRSPWGRQEAHQPGEEAQPQSSHSRGEEAQPQSALSQEKNAHPQSALSRGETAHPWSAPRRREEAHPQPALSRGEEAHPWSALSGGEEARPQASHSGEEEAQPQASHRRGATWHCATSAPRTLSWLFLRRTGKTPLVGRRRLSSTAPSGSSDAQGTPTPSAAVHASGRADASDGSEGGADEQGSAPEAEHATTGVLPSQPPRLLKWRTAEGAMEWPAFLFGNTVRGPWQRPYTSSSFRVAPSCALVRPSPSSRVPVWPLTTGKAMSREEWLLELNRTRVGRSPRLRAVLWLPFNGLGNVLRAAPVAMAYALISGRRLLRCTSGPNHQVMKSICDAFDCGLDSLADIGDPTPISKRIEGLGGEDPLPISKRIEGLGVLRWAKSAADTRMFFLWDRTFEQWDSDPKVRRCVMDSFECVDMWCVNSKALQLLLLEPTSKLNDIIQEYFTLAPQDVRLPAPLPPPAGVLEAPRLPGRSLLQQQLGQAREQRRGLGDVTGLQQQTGATPVQLQQQRLQQQRLQEQRLQQQQQSGPMGLTQQQHPSAGTQAQKGQQQRQQKEAGSIKEGLYLEPDLGLHIRVVHRCVEVDPTAPHCRVSGLQESITRSKNERRLRSAIAAPVWACISTLLSHLHALKLLYLEDQGWGGEAGAGAQGEGPVPRITWTPKYRAAFSRLLTGSSPSNVSGLWSIERAHTFAAAQLPRSRRVPLSIFLATDSEILRPLLVEFLRPFGTVIFSRALVAHTSTSSGATAEVEAVMGKARLAAVGEFFTLSKSSVIHIPTNYRLGTFSFKAAEYGNSTLVIRERFNCSNRCCFQVPHWGERQ